MKGKGARFVKQIISMVRCVSRAKCMAIRNKTDAMKAQFMVTALTVLSKKDKLISIGAISDKISDAIEGLLMKANHDNNGSKEDVEAELVSSSKAIVLYTNNNKAVVGGEMGNIHIHDDEFVIDEDKYPDLRHSLFDEEEEEELAQLLDDPSSSISAIDIVKNSKENRDHGFNLEEEIDEVADLFISKFHKNMRLQKLLSFKRQHQDQMMMADK
ncbi:hypothetical protein ABFX02_11G082900 [Erythranthe guttata]